MQSCKCQSFNLTSLTVRLLLTKIKVDIVGVAMYFVVAVKSQKIFTLDKNEQKPKVTSNNMEYTPKYFLKYAS